MGLDDCWLSGSEKSIKYQVSCFPMYAVRKPHTAESSV